MSNIIVDYNAPIQDGTEVVFRSPVDCSQITGLKVNYSGGSQEFMLADAHGNNVGDIDHLFAEDVVVKVILDVDAGMAFVQNADTNSYLEYRFGMLADSIVEEATGNPITLKDSSNRELQVLNLYGKTTQNGTPTPDAPVAMEVAGNDGSVEVKVMGENEEQTHTVPTPGGLPGIGDFCDEIDFVKGTYTKKMKTIVLTGKESVHTASNHFAIYVGVGSDKAYENSKTRNALSNYYPGTTREDIEKTTHGISASNEYIRLIDTTRFSAGDTATVKQFLADRYAEGNPVIVQYVLAEANWEETELTAEQLEDYANCDLHTYKPNTTIISNAGMKVEYVADTKAYIDNKFTELQNAILASGANV